MKNPEEVITDSFTRCTEAANVAVPVTLMTVVTIQKHEDVTNGTVRAIRFRWSVSLDRVNILDGDVRGCTTEKAAIREAKRAIKGYSIRRCESPKSYWGGTPS